MLIETLDKYIDAASILKDPINDMEIDDIMELVKEDQKILGILNKENKEIIESLMEGGLL
jgi:hypothetical protein